MSSGEIKHPPVATVNEVKALKAAAKPYESRDAAVRGGYVIKYPSGALAYCVRYRIHNQKRKLTFGVFDVASGGLAAMRAKARKALSEVDAARHSTTGTPDPVAAKRAARAERVAAEAAARAAKRAGKDGLAGAAQAHPESVEHAVEQFAQRHLSKIRTGAVVARILRREVVGRWRGRRLADVTRADVHKALDEVADRAPIQANRVAAYLSKFFRWTTTRGIIAANPIVGGIERPAEERKRKRTLDDRELSLVWAAAEGMGYPFGPIVQLLILTGQRKSEIGEAHWSEINLDGKFLDLPAARVKNKKPHCVPLSPQVMTILESLPRYAGSDLVFTTNGKTSVSGFSRAKRALDKQVAVLNGGEAIPEFTIHDLRRSCAAGLQRLGVDTRVIERALNHVSGVFAGITSVYQTHDFAEEKRDALNRWGAHIGRVISGANEKKIIDFPRR